MVGQHGRPGARRPLARPQERPKSTACGGTDVAAGTSSRELVPERTLMRRQQDVPGAPGEVIRLDGVTKAYQAGSPPALDNVTMSVADGEVAAIMGPSGSG